MGKAQQRKRKSAGGSAERLAPFNQQQQQQQQGSPRTKQRPAGPTVAAPLIHLPGFWAQSGRSLGRGALLPLRVAAHAAWLVLPGVLVVGGAVLCCVLLYLALQRALLLPALSLSASLARGASGALAGALQGLPCSLPIVGLYLCAGGGEGGPPQSSAARLRAQLGLVAETAESSLRNSTAIVDLVTATPDAQRIQQMVDGAYTLSQAFGHRSTLPNRAAIARDFAQIGDTANALVDAVVEVETNGRILVRSILDGFDEVVEMLRPASGAEGGAVRYAPAVVEARLERHLDSVAAAMGTLQDELVRAQSLASEALAVQRALVGKLYDQQTALEDAQLRHRDAAAGFFELVQSSFSISGDSDGKGKGKSNPDRLSAAEMVRLRRNLDLCNVALEEMGGYSRHFSQYLVFLKRYRAQVTARRRQLGEHRWVAGELALEDRLRSIGNLIEPVRRKLHMYEEQRATHLPHSHQQQQPRIER